MDKISAAFAKLAGLQKNLHSIRWSNRNNVSPTVVDPLIHQYSLLIDYLTSEIPELYGDMSKIMLPNSASILEPYYRDEVDPLIQSVDYMIEVRANHRIGEKFNNEDKPKKIFISHGRSEDWLKVQPYLEKDLLYLTLELAQEVSKGRTVLQKLNDEANRCNCAVIVMTGDDIMGEAVRARENVMHEIGFFQGKYGLHNVVILHEEGVSIPSNIHGLIYVPFPKGSIEATFHVLARELKAIIN